MSKIDLLRKTRNDAEKPLKSLRLLLSKTLNRLNRSA